MSARLTDLELLMLQAEPSLDQRGRLSGLCGLMIGTSPDGQLLLAGSEVPDAVAAALTHAFDASRPAPGAHQEPPALAACREILRPACGPLVLQVSRYYCIESLTAPVAPGVTIVRSDHEPDARLRSLNPGNWGTDEWGVLLDGTLGPWAMGVVDNLVVSICHTPGPMSERVAECGVWTHPEFRGRGYAAAVTAAWADIVRPSGRLLFYSTDRDNLSSQKVAARLHLREIGWTWNLARETRGLTDSQHPLMPPPGQASL